MHGVTTKSAQIIRTSTFVGLVALAVHLAACLILLPPAMLLQREPLLSGDFPIHSYRVHMYRSALAASGLPWGCNPALSAGVVTSPVEDIGAKPLQIARLMLPWADDAGLVRWATFLTMLLFPLGVAMACRTLALPTPVRVGALVSVIFLVWTNPNVLLAFRWGMVCFAAASFLSPWVLALLLRHAREPGAGRAWALFMGFAALFGLHLLGPLMIAAPLMALLCGRSQSSWKRRVVVLGATAALVNAFWFVPFLVGYLHEPAAWGEAALSGLARDLTFARAAHAAPGSLPLALAACIRFVLPLAAIPFLCKAADPTTGRILAVAAVGNLAIMLAGSFVPVLKQTQPLRFILPWTAMASIPIGYLVAWLVAPPGRRFAAPALVALAAVVAGSAAWGRAAAVEDDECVTLSARPESGALLHLQPPKSIAGSDSAGSLTRLMLRTSGPADRILVQTRFKADPEAFALGWKREVAGCTYPLNADPLHFDRFSLFGRRIGERTPGELRAAIDLWGITKLVAWSREAVAALEAVCGPGERVGEYVVFAVPGPPSRFLVGSGQVQVSVNRIELTDLQVRDGLVVVRYRYHPAWRAEPAMAVDRYPVTGVTSGFIALRNPPEHVILRFDPAKVFRQAYFEGH